MKTDFIDSISSYNSFAEDNVSLKQDYLIQEQHTQPISDNEVNPKVEEMKTFSNFYRKDLTVKLEASSPRDPSQTARQAIDDIDNLPKPDKKGIPSNLPPEDRQSIYNSRVEQYNQERAKIADKAVNDSRPPSITDYNYLPPHLRDAKYNEELINYNERIAELKQVSLKSKQEILKVDSQFQKLPLENQKLVNDSMVKNQAVPKDVDTIVNLARTEGFSNLKPEEQTKMLNYVGGTNTELSQPARQELRKILDNPNVDKNNPETFRKFLKDQPGLKDAVEGSENNFAQFSRKYEIKGNPVDVKDYKFNSGKADALKYEVVIDGKTIPVYMPKNPNPNEHYPTIEEVAKGLAKLPPDSLDAVNSISVNPGQNPEDEELRKRYNDPGFRSHMSTTVKGNIQIYPSNNNKNQDEFVISLVHETSHIISQKKWGSSRDILSRGHQDIFGKTSWKQWEEAKNKDGISPSKYANANIDEDFAETYILYMQVKGTPKESEIRAIMPERFRILDEITK